MLDTLFCVVGTVLLLVRNVVRRCPSHMFLERIGPKIIAPVDTAEEAKGKWKEQSGLGIKSIGHSFVVLKFIIQETNQYLALNTCSFLLTA